MTIDDEPSSDVGEVTIRADHLRKVHGDFVALHELSFEVRRGRVTAFLGPNGAGKSTTMKLLTGYLAPSSGRASVLGLDPTDAEQRRALAHRLGYMPENGPLYADMTPAEMLRFCAEVRGLPNAKGAIERVVEQCRLSEVVHKAIRKLSKGFRQRVGMAQALLADPEVLILDEPSSGLDPLQIRELRTLIRELGRDKTILLSTHILQEVEAVADDVLMLAAGRLVFAGALGQLDDEGGLEQRFIELAGGARDGGGEAA